jgi:hypothetical protein
MDEIKHMLEVRKNAYEKAKHFDLWTDLEKPKKTAERISLELEKWFK